MQIFHCGQCRAQVYFENTHCYGCGALLGFMPTERAPAAFSLEPDGALSRLGDEVPQQFWKFCAERENASRCNWVVDALDPCPTCWSCRLTEPQASASPFEHGQRWLVAETAKRRLLFTLLQLEVPFGPKQSDDDISGLRFIWQVPQAGQAAPRVLTGHVNGTVTLNLLEADDDRREAVRVSFGEPQRTVLGHLRHEVSHHLHQRWVMGSANAQACVELFGDETADYSAAMQRYYQNGPLQTWQSQYISAYATMHPWEDWAETCGHYLMIVDAVETAAAWGLHLEGHLQDGVDTLDHRVSMKSVVLEQWLPVARFLNAMSRSIGVRDNYPFLMPEPVLNKMRFVRRVLAQAAGTPVPGPRSAAGP
jgi:hypothetical protein